jgi:hypothetical protein
MQSYAIDWGLGWGVAFRCGNYFNIRDLQDGTVGASFTLAAFGWSTLTHRARASTSSTSCVYELMAFSTKG